MGWQWQVGPFQGSFYPSTRQHSLFGSTYKSLTRQITRQEASATRQKSGELCAKQSLVHTYCS
jgi:hypothetical protein